MRSLLIVGLLVVTLIVGILVINNLRTESVDGSKKIESIDRAKDAKDTTEKAGQKIKDDIEALGD